MAEEKRGIFSILADIFRRRKKETEREFKREYALADAFSRGRISPAKGSLYLTLSFNRFARYVDYETMELLIPEVARAISTYIDLILHPEYTTNDVLIVKSSDARIKEVVGAIIKHINLIDYLSSIIHDVLLYGDCFLKICFRKDVEEKIRERAFEIARVTSSEIGNEEVLVESDVKEEERKEIEKRIINFIINGAEEKQLESLLENSEYYSGRGSILFETSFREKVANILDDLKNIYRDVRLEDIFIEKIHPGRVIRLDLGRKDTIYIIYKERQTVGAGSSPSSFDILKKRGSAPDKIFIAPLSFRNGEIYPNHRIVHIKYRFSDLFSPYGVSILEPARHIAQKLLLLELYTVIYRMTRASEKRVFRVDVTDVEPVEIPAVIQRFKELFRKKDFFDGVSITKLPDLITVADDYWIPVRNGSPLIEIDTLESGSLTESMEDVNYFKKKLIAALGIPPAYLSYEEETPSKAVITMEDIRLSRTVTKIQEDISKGLKELIDRILAITGYCQFLDEYEISLFKPTVAEELLSADVLAQKSSIISVLSSLGVPKEFLLKKYLKFSEKELKEIEGYLIKRKAEGKEEERKSKEETEEEFGW